MAIPLVLIHGFTQNAACWPGIAEPLAAGRPVLAVDVPGHGRAADVPAGPWEAADLIAGEGGAGDYLGYSLGGRIALHIALRHPGLVRRLILVSATPGIEDAAERAERRLADQDLAAELEASGDLAGFLDRWLSAPLFATLDPARSARDARLTNTVAGLASSLRLCGTGSQDNLWPRLDEISQPVLVVAGSEDAKYSRIAERLAATLPDARLAIVPGAGHACHLERPEAFVRLVDEFLA